MNRFFISLSCLFLTTLSIHSSALKNQPYQHIELITKYLSPEELQFVANFCLINQQYIFIDRLFNAALYDHIKIVRSCHNRAFSATMPEGSQEALDQSYNNYRLLFNTRHIWQKRYLVYKQEVDKEHSAQLDAALNTLYMYANGHIDECIQTINPQLDIKLEAVAALLERTSGSLQALATNYGDLRLNTFPFDVQPDQLYYTKMAYIEHLSGSGLELAYNICEGNDFLLAELDRAKKEFCDLFLTWYSIVYQQLTKQTSDKHYFTFIFNADDSSPESFIEFLPEPPQTSNS